MNFLSLSHSPRTQAYSPQLFHSSFLNPPLPFLFFILKKLFVILNQFSFIDHLFLHKKLPTSSHFSTIFSLCYQLFLNSRSYLVVINIISFIKLYLAFLFNLFYKSQNLESLFLLLIVVHKINK